jgi:tripartite motif-containing protein 56
MRFKIKMAVASSRVDRVDEVMYLYECSICFEYFNDPKQLPCRHSFCCVCLERFVDKRRSIAARESREVTEFDCPYCLSKFTLSPEEQVAGLPSNDFLRKLLQVFQPKQGESAPNCSLCDELAIIVCEECEKVLCKGCHIEHKSLSEFQEHEVQSLSEMLDRDRLAKIGTHKMRCVLHRNVSPNFYCETCEELICLRCISSRGKIYIHTEPDHVCVGVHEVDSKLRAALKLNCEATDANLTEGKHALQVIDNSTNYHKETADRLIFQIRTQQERVLNDFTEILNEKAQDVISIVNQEYNPVVGGLR